jgi:hypothetical protein
MGIIMGTTTGMRISHRSVASSLSLVAASLTWAQTVTVRIADRPDPKFKASALTFLVENRNPYDLSVCVTNEWNISDEPIVNDVTPFDLQSFSRGKWHYVIGNDMANHWITWIDGRKTISFSMHKPDPGTYRVVMRYRKREDFKDCHEFHSKHVRSATSAPFTIR